MKLLLTAAAALAAITAVPAAAATYDAFAAFTPGSATSGPFTFGSVAGGVFNAFPTGNPCLLQNTVCLTTSDYLGVYKTFDGAAHPGSGTIDVPADALIFHPGANGQVAAVFFTAPTTGVYTLTLNAFQATNTNANSVNIFGYSINSLTPLTLATLTASSPTFAYGNPGFFLNAGDVFGLGVDFDGNYQYDSTGISFSISTGAVPEPATWALMIGGFGLVGGAMRRRLLANA